jgi:hypothetical protein
VPHHQGEAAVGHHLAQVVGVADETVHAIGNEPVFDAQREVLLGIGGDHDHGYEFGRVDLLVSNAPQDFAKSFSGGCHVTLCGAGDADGQRFRRAGESSVVRRVPPGVIFRGFATTR